MRAGMSYFHETIWNGLPKFLRRVDTALSNIGVEERLPYNVPLIQFSSWMGGDRDGIFELLHPDLHFFLILRDGMQNLMCQCMWLFRKPSCNTWGDTGCMFAGKAHGGKFILLANRKSDVWGEYGNLVQFVNSIYLLWHGVYTNPCPIRNPYTNGKFYEAFLMFNAIQLVYVFQLSMWRCSDELRSRVQQIEASNRKDSKHYMGMGIQVI